MVLGLAWPSGPARADYQLCNRTSYVLEAALAIETGGATATQGWFQIAPGDCSVILSGGWTGERYFLHTRTPEFYREAPEAQQVSRMFCVKTHDFLIPGAEECPDTDGSLASFTEFRPDRDEDLTTTEFTDASRFSMEQARISGVQRLLALLGHEPGPVDGAAGSPTERAIADFIAAGSLGERRTDLAILMDELIREARARADGTGLTLCNRTGRRLMAAIASDSGDGINARGWFELEAGACHRAIAEALGQRRYYVYAEAVDAKGRAVKRDGEALAWSGGTELCTRNFRFEISDHGDCVPRGLRPAQFRALATGGAKSHTVTFTEANAGQSGAAK